MAKTLAQKFCSWLGKARGKSQLSLRELEAKTGVSYSRIFAIEKQERDPTIDDLDKLAPAFNVKPSEVLAQLEGNGNGQ